MNEVEAGDALGAADRLLLCRFSPNEAERLIALRRRAERGDFRELTDAARLAFARWLVARGRLTEWPADSNARSSPGALGARVRVLDASPSAPPVAHRTA